MQRFGQLSPFLESYAARPEVRNNHAFLVIVVLGGNEISVSTTCSESQK